ncbi:MAG: DoxX protein [Alistipes sp.]
MQSKYWKIAATVCRLILGVTFIFSGFSKVIDPWGTSLKVNEYLSIYSAEWLTAGSMGFSIWLCGAELMMGCMLLFKVRIRLISIFAFVSMLFFSLLTFFSATWIPVEDCGCFGEAIKLSPWQTFTKNIVLLPMAYIVWRRYRPDKIFSFTQWEIFLTCLFFSLSMGIGIYCYRHLPLIDFLPYHEGLNLREARFHPDTDQHESTTTLIYRNRATGEEHEFSLDDAEWRDDTKWEWVETSTESTTSGVRPLIGEFSLRDAEGDATEEILSDSGKVYMLCATSFAHISRTCDTQFKKVVEYAQQTGARVVCLTPEPLRDITYHTFAGSIGVRCYNIDATTLKTMLRADTGLIVLSDGVIKAKRNCRDLY